MDLTAALLPAHPADGSESMWRYWQEMRTRLAGPEYAIRIREPFAPVGSPSRAHLLRRAWSKHLWYPWRVERISGVNLVHLLDHSFAHVLKRIPAAVPIVVTVHDLAPLAVEEGLSGAQVRRFRRSLEQVRRAVRVVVPSHFTAGQVTDVLRIENSRIAVVPMGVNHATFIPRVTAAPINCVLSVGSCTPRKNLSLLPEVFRAAAKQVPRLRLIRVGEPLPAALRRELASVLDGRLEERGRVDDRALAALYADALALIVPSRLEGFGLPVLEAMACGCPVVCSNAASLPEAGGDVGLYFDPSDAETAASHLIALARKPEHRVARIDAGRARAAHFTWAAHAARLVDIYRDVATTVPGSTSRRPEPMPS